MDTDIALIEALERKALWLSTWMIHNANHLRENRDGLKVGGHQASSASMVSILAALYFDALVAEDRVAVKPHASPAFHAIQYLLGRIGQDMLENFRGFGGAQSYPSRTKDVDDVDFSTGSVGLGVAQTLFAAMTQEYLRAKGLGERGPGRMIALAGDAEIDEGNIFEALLEGWKHDVRDVWWVIDYNRQSLDAVVREGLWSRFESIFRDFGWDVVILKHGRLQQQAFAESGGQNLQEWIDACPNQLYSALTFQGGAAWRARLLADLGHLPDTAALIGRRDDASLARLMNNLGGHDIAGLIEAFSQARGTDRPTCFIAYTIKGYGLPLAGHKDNHAGLLTPAQIDQVRADHHVRTGHEWEKFEGLPVARPRLEEHLRRRAHALACDIGTAVPIAPPAIRAPARSGPISTQQGFGQILNDLGRDDSDFVRRIVTTAPDVTVSTNLGGWVNRRGLFARETTQDLFKSERIASTFTWEFSPAGQHIELGIAEMNLFTMLSALGLSRELFGQTLIPIGTVYDPFICRGLDALNYACYQDARFILVATPSGITLAPEGGAHQSIMTPLIGMAQDGLAAFEPAFVDELAVILGFAFEHIQAPRQEGGGSVYLRLSTRPMEQPARSIDAAMAGDIIEGAYWLRPPGPNTEVIIAATGAVVPEAIEAVGMLAEDRRDVGLLAITSSDRLHAGWTNATRVHERGFSSPTPSHIDRLLAGVPRNAGIVTVLDGHPATLAWLGAVRGHRARALGVEHFGQSGTIADLYAHHGIDADAIARAAEALSPGKPVRHIRSAA